MEPLELPQTKLCNRHAEEQMIEIEKEEDCLHESKMRRIEAEIELLERKEDIAWIEYKYESHHQANMIHLDEELAESQRKENMARVLKPTCKVKVRQRKPAVTKELQMPIAEPETQP